MQPHSRRTNGQFNQKISRKAAKPQKGETQCKGGVMKAVDQPVAKTAGSEPKDLESCAHRNLGAKVSVGRTKQHDTRGQPRQNLDRA